MEYKVKARISNRHVHLTEDTYYKLFDTELEKKYDLKQRGQFAAKQTLTIKNGDVIIPNVRVVGPFRNYNQIEISKSDARKLGLNPPVRSSGDLKDSLIITLKTDKDEVNTNGLIIANRHIHMNYDDAKKYNVQDKDIVKIRIPGDKEGILSAEIKVSEDGYFEVHLDTDDGNAFLLNDNDDITMII